MSREKAKISVIVPVYNASRYLRRCLDSLVNQTMKEIEIILVDDASQDGSTNIIKEYMLQYPDIITCIHHETNLGPGGARNTGLKNAMAEYVIFIDSDDLVKSDICEKMYNVAKSKDSDIVCCDYYHEKNGDFGELEFFPTCVTGEVTSKKLELLIPLLTASPVAKLIRKSILMDHQLFFPEKMTFEDLATVPTWFLYFHQVDNIREPLYYVVENPNSLTRTKNTNGYYDVFPAVQRVCDELQKRGYHNQYVMDMLLCRGLLDEMNYFMGRMTQIDKAKLEKLKNEVKKYIPDYKENKILYKIGEPKAIAAAQLFMKDTDRFIQMLEHQQWSELGGSYVPYYEQGILFWKQVLDYCQNNHFRIAIWGAGGKGSSFLNYYDKGHQYISYVIDTNEKRWGEHMETGHEICSFEYCMDQVDVVIIMNRLYSGMIKRKVKSGKKEIRTIEYDMYVLWGEEDKLEMFIE